MIAPWCGSSAARRSSTSAETISSETNSPASITALMRSPSSVPAFFSARSMSPVDIWPIPRSATSRSAWVPLPAPGGPKRMMFTLPLLLRPRRSAQTPALELRLLDQVAILVRQQMRLNLSHRVHRHDDDAQQAGAAEVERNLERGDMICGHQSDECEVRRADYGDASQHVIEIHLGVLAWADARDEPAIA